MEISEIYQFLRSRIGWLNMRSICLDNNIVTGVGWDKTFEKIIESYPHSEDINKVSKVFNDAYINTIYYGEKLVSLAKTDPDILANILLKIKKLDVDSNIFTDSFPYPISLDSLKLQSILPKLVSIRKEDDGYSLVYCSKRLYSVRQNFEVDKMNDAVQATFNGYDSLIAIKYSVKQAFDIVKINYDGYIEFKVDLIEEIGFSDHLMFKGNLAEAFYTSISKDLGVPNDYLKPVNMYSLLEKFYDEDGGRIVEIGHDTGTHGGIIREKMRRKSLDVRVEGFHKAGMDAVVGVSLFSLAKAWTISGSDGEPELQFLGTSKILSATKLEIYDVLLKGCISEKHFYFILDKIKKYL